MSVPLDHRDLQRLPTEFQKHRDQDMRPCFLQGVRRGAPNVEEQEMPELQ